MPQAWLAVLEELQARALLAAEGDDVDADWREPADVGSLPPEHLERALEVLALQREMLRTLTIERDSVRRHLEAVRTVPAVSDDVAVYLDVEG
jgi:hypothetical protein